MELKSSRYTSILYHDIFDYKLTKEESVRWQYKHSLPSVEVKNKKSKKRLQREKYSRKKIVIAKKAAALISKIPTVKFVGITGSLAMMNANRNSDIDLIIITKSGMLWLTRLVVLVILVILSIPFRRFGKNEEKDKLCLNMWLDESDLVWNPKERNIYTAHEIAQIVPLFNKGNIYEKFIYLNRWILTFWPNSLKNVNWKFIGKCKLENVNSTNIVEYMAYKIQYWYMYKKITREVITPTRAIFHPNDWGKIISDKLYRNKQINLKSSTITL